MQDHIININELFGSNQMIAAFLRLICLAKVNYKQYHPQTSSNFNTPDSYIKIEIPREDTHISLYESYLQIEVDVTKNDNNRFVDDNWVLT